jgi:hypothetical protein
MKRIYTIILIVTLLVVTSTSSAQTQSTTSPDSMEAGNVPDVPVVFSEYLAGELAQQPDFSFTGIGWPGLRHSLSYRGLHPAYTRFVFRDIPLTSSLLGSWDMQDIPRQSALPAERQILLPGAGTQEFGTAPVPYITPLTRMVYQDGALGRNQVDILFRRALWRQTQFAADVSLQQMDGTGGREDLKGKRIGVFIDKALPRQWLLQTTVLLHRRDVNTAAQPTNHMEENVFAQRDSARWHERRMTTDAALSRHKYGELPEMEFHLTVSDFIGKFRTPVTIDSHYSAPLKERLIALSGNIVREAGTGTWSQSMRLLREDHRLETIQNGAEQQAVVLYDGNVTSALLQTGYQSRLFANHWQVSAQAGLRMRQAFDPMPIVESRLQYGRKGATHWYLRGYLDGRFPTIAEQHYQYSAQYTTFEVRPTLKSSGVAGVETGFSSPADKPYRYTGSIYWQQSQEPLMWATSSDCVNAPSYHAAGLTGSGWWSPNPSWRFDSSMHFQFRSADRYSYAPRSQGHFALTLIDSITRLIPSSLRSELRLSAEHIGRRQALYYIPGIRTVGIQADKLSSVWVVNLQGIAALGRFRALYALDNILNKRYTAVLGYPMPLRTVRFGVIWEFEN